MPAHLIAYRYVVAGRMFVQVGGESRHVTSYLRDFLFRPDQLRTPARALCDRLVTRGFHNGLLLLSCGVSTLRFMPPLSVTTAEVDEAVVLLRCALDEALQGKTG